MSHRNVTPFVIYFYSARCVRRQKIHRHYLNSIALFWFKKKKSASSLKYCTVFTAVSFLCLGIRCPFGSYCFNGKLNSLIEDLESRNIIKVWLSLYERLSHSCTDKNMSCAFAFISHLLPQGWWAADTPVNTGHDRGDMLTLALLHLKGLFAQLRSRPLRSTTLPTHPPPQLPSRGFGSVPSSFFVYRSGQRDSDESVQLVVLRQEPQIHKSIFMFLASPPSSSWTGGGVTCIYFLPLDMLTVQQCRPAQPNGSVDVIHLLARG